MFTIHRKKIENNPITGGFYSYTDKKAPAKCIFFLLRKFCSRCFMGNEKIVIPSCYLLEHEFGLHPVILNRAEAAWVIAD
jgi:hypothetical protein